MATIHTKLSIGDEAWVIIQRRFERQIRCTTCQHTGKVVIGGEEFTCPNCKGRSLRAEYAGHKWVIETSGKVGRISAILGFEDCPRETTYMIDTTGIGSGSIWAESNCFPDRAAATAECERRNAGGNWQDDEAAA